MHPILSHVCSKDWEQSWWDRRLQALQHQGMAPHQEGVWAHHQEGIWAHYQALLSPTNTT